MSVIRILDLDNCIADDGWRVPLIDYRLPDPWSAYHDGIPLDRAHHKHLFRAAIPLGLRIHFFTARPEKYFEITKLWLARHNLMWDRLWMRADDDFRSSVEVKKDMLLETITCHEVYDAYDDTLAIVNMYKDFRVRAHHLRIHCVPYPQRAEHAR